MKPSERAKIFMPFSPLKNFEEALRKKERILVPKSELAEERIEEIDAVLRSLDIGSEVEIVYYCDGIYEKISGYVSSIDNLLKTVCIAKRSIEFDLIYDIKVK